MVYRHGMDVGILHESDYFISLRLYRTLLLEKRQRYNELIDVEHHCLLAPGRRIYAIIWMACNAANFKLTKKRPGHLTRSFHFVKILLSLNHDLFCFLLIAGNNGNKILSCVIKMNNMLVRSRSLFAEGVRLNCSASNIHCLD